jgi:GxxExxY protein
VATLSTAFPRNDSFPKPRHPEAQHGATEYTERSDEPSYGGELSERVIGSAIDVHRQLGPGLLESVYEECLCFELRHAGMAYGRQVPLALVYKTIRLECGYRMDVVVERQLIIEIKAVEQLLPIHEAQMLTYLRLSGHRVALLMNFNNVALKNGLRRFVL